MELSQQQREAVSQWVAAGESLASVQRRLREEFSISMTYMEVRFLVDDLGLELKTPEKPKPATPPGALAANPPAPADPLAPVPAGADALPSDPDAEFAEDLADELAQSDVPAGGGVKVDVDRIVRPGAVVSGSVTFSDGKSAKWALDQTGRLMLDGGAGYKPSQDDIRAFQQELSMQLQRHGY
jgi:hypothetical protein